MSSIECVFNFITVQYYLLTIHYALHYTIMIGYFSFIYFSFIQFSFIYFLNPCGTNFQEIFSFCSSFCLQVYSIAHCGNTQRKKISVYKKLMLLVQQINLHLSSQKRIIVRMTRNCVASQQLMNEISILSHSNLLYLWTHRGSEIKLMF